VARRRDRGPGACLTGVDSTALVPHVFSLLETRPGARIMSNQALESAINAAWENRDEVNVYTRGETREAVDQTLDLLDSGQVRVAQKSDGLWKVNEWVKKAILLSFQLRDMVVTLGGPRDTSIGEAAWFDKVPPKFAGWNEERFRSAGFRAVPGSFVRHSAFIGPKVVLMPCFVNVGARVESGCMIDTWATVGSCAQIGKNVHLSGGAGIGGVLEPVQANPVIIEDDCFIGARAEVAEGVIVEQGSVLSMGVYIGASTKIVDRATGAVHQGRVPAYSVVVPGTLPGPALPDGGPGPGLYCVVIVKKVDEKTRAKTSINELLRT
jgi:2,3,4,5-tetrahydropyridine-2-carboxylate N-succinyltransferase